MMCCQVCLAALYFYRTIFARTIGNLAKQPNTICDHKMQILTVSQIDIRLLLRPILARPYH
jgi:hypothetical protein